MSRLASRLPAWPFVLLVLAIALLSLLAPSTWRGRFSEPVDAPPTRDAARRPSSALADAASTQRTGPANPPLPGNAIADVAETEVAGHGPLTFVATPVPDPDYALPETMLPAVNGPPNTDSSVLPTTQDSATAPALATEPPLSKPMARVPSATEAVADLNGPAPAIAPPVPTSSPALTVGELAAMERAATEPTATEPAATQPAATEPAATEPAATEPAATEPAATEPAATDASATEPAANERAAAEAAATEPATTGPKITGGPAANPATTESATTESATTESATTESATTESATTEPVAAGPANSSSSNSSKNDVAASERGGSAAVPPKLAANPAEDAPSPLGVLGQAGPVGGAATDANEPGAAEPAGEKLAEVVDETGLAETGPRPSSGRRSLEDSAANGRPSNDASAELMAALPTPATLLEELRSLREQGVLASWSDAIRVRLERLTRLPRLDDPSAPAILQELGTLADQAGPLSMPLGESPERVRILRAAYGVSRRVAVWHSLCQLATLDRSGNDWSLTVSRQLEAAQLAVEVHLARSQYRELWRGYLCLDRAKDLVGSMDEPTTRQRDIARMILTRLDVDTLNESQARFLSHPVFQNYRAALRAYSRQEVPLTDIVQLIERYETTLASLDARRVAHGFQTLRWSPLEAETQAAQPINDHYRNANVRVAISAALINRILPTEHTSFDPVDDVIQSARVQGTSRTSSRLRVFLVPSRLQWRLGLEARGDVASQTESRKGPATFYQDAMANFDARKHVTVDKRGIRTDRAEARAQSSSDLRGFETDFDDIPLFNRLARGIANRQYQEQSTLAAAEVESRVADIASQRLDEEVHKRLSDAEGEFQTRWLMPLRNMGLDPTPVDFETTNHRLIVRYRIAAIHQLAAHTPRPQAPTNSWLSVQLHESAINNTLDQLGLGGRKLTIQELCDELARKFGRPSPPVPEDIPEDMTVTLAQNEGIRVRCDGGRMRLTLRVAELSQNRHTKWRNFMVQTTYVPSPDQRNANLVRDGIIELSSDGKGVGNQFALRTIFSKVLSKNRSISLINHSMAQQPEFADLMINQFVLSDGWIGIAMAPKPNTARIPYRRSFH